jgi:hypothetical protein
MAASRSSVSTSMLRYFFEEKVINSPAPVHQWHVLAICERRVPRCAAQLHDTCSCGERGAGSNASSEGWNE